jgi:hypothetical protein
MSFKSRRTFDFRWRLRAEPFSHERFQWLHNLAADPFRIAVVDRVDYAEFGWSCCVPASTSFTND